MPHLRESSPIALIGRCGILKPEAAMGAELVVRETAFDFDYQDNYPPMITALTGDPDRNQLIASDVIEYAKSGANPALVVSDRKQHCQMLADLIRKAGIRVAVLTGDLNAKKRYEIIDALSCGRLDALISTVQLIGEGFDSKNLSALFLATPIKSAPKLQQLVGRVLRVSEGKAVPKIFDYQDQNGVLAASLRTRIDTYQRLGISMAN
jgi:superfamily II DNA or RNA helicase